MAAGAPGREPSVERPRRAVRHTGPWPEAVGAGYGGRDRRATTPADRVDGSGGRLRGRANGKTGGLGALATTTAALALLAAVLVPAGPAAAAPADDCAAPTRTVAGSSSGTPLSIAAGEVVLLASGTQTGGVDALPAGSTLCVAPGATLSPAYLNNGAGTIYVAPGGTATMPSIAVNAGFALDNAGTTTFAGLNLNGPGTVRNEAGATLTVSGAFTPAAGTILNEGVLALPGGMTLNAQVSLTNDGVLTAGGNAVVNGPFVNAGRAAVGGNLVVNGSGTLQNRCVLQAGGDLTNAGQGSTNTGLVQLGGGFANLGGASWRQTFTGALSGTTLQDDGAITGFGRYVLTGQTSVQGSFTGDSALLPILVDVPGTTPPYFDVATGTIANVARVDLTLPPAASYPGPDCADRDVVPSADVQVAKTGPATVETEGEVGYTITVTNHGPGAAEGVVVTDTLPADLVGPVADTGGVVAPPTVTWTLGTLAVDQTVTLTVTGTAPAGAGVLTNTVSATATTPDPDASNNDGTAPSETVTTEVVEVAPPLVDPPQAPDETREGFAGVPIVSVLVGTSPDPDLQLRYTVVSGVSDGRLVLLPNGLFGYLPATGFVGTDTFTYRVCDNQTPSQCSEVATVTLIVHPRAVDDVTTTLMGQPVTIDVLANDPAGAVLSTTLETPASHGLVQVDPATGTLLYTPGANYLGDDQLAYRACAPDDADDCATAVVTVHVIPDNLPPLAPTLTMETSVGTPVSGAPAVTDPDGDATTLTAVFPPVTGSATLDAVAGTTTYVPPPGFAGRDLYQYTVCDDGIPVLCATGLVTVLVDPVAVDDTATTPEGTPVTIDVAANDQGTVLPPDVEDPPAHGTVTLVDGAFVYTPDPGFTGTDTFVYRVCAADVSPACAVATVTVVVTAVPDEPGTGGGTDGSGSGGGTGGTGGAGAAGGDRLPVTGADPAGPAALALALLVAGTGVLLARRWRRAHPSPR